MSLFPWETVISVQDPVYTSYLEKETFLEIYQKLINQLNIEAYFERSPLNNTILLFINDQVKLDFADKAVRLELIPSYQEICEGVSKENKFESKTEQKIKQLQKKLKQLRQELISETHPDRRKRLNKSIRTLIIKINTRDFTV